MQTKQFKNIYFGSCPRNTTFPGGYAIWSGTSGSHGVGSTNTVALSPITTDTLTVSALCGTSVTAYIQKVAIAFHSHATNDGFDFKELPFSTLVVPTTGSKTVDIVTTPTGISNYVFSVEDSPTSVTIFPDHGSNTPLVLGLADHHYPVNGFAPMHAAVHSYLTSRSGPELTIANCSTGTLNVCLRDQRTVRVDFHIMRDSAAVTHTTTVTEAQIDGIVTALNNVWTPQANIVFIKGSVATNTLAGDRGLNIETNVGTSGMVDEWPLITAFNSGIPQSFNVYFVWGGWTSYDDATHTWSQPDVGLAIRNGNHFDTLISDTAMAQIPALAHELGHLLGLWWLPNHLGDYDLTASNGDELMVADTFGTGTLVRHYQVDFIPDH